MLFCAPALLMIASLPEQLRLPSASLPKIAAIAPAQITREMTLQHTILTPPPMPASRIHQLILKNGQSRPSRRAPATGTRSRTR